jgi:hypothetical protein
MRWLGKERDVGGEEMEGCVCVCVRENVLVPTCILQRNT